MSRVVVIGADGRIGTYLVPRLVEAGHHVVAASRGNAKPYLFHARPDRKRANRAREFIAAKCDKMLFAILP